MADGPHAAIIITVPLDGITRGTTRRKRSTLTYDLHSQEIRGLEEYTEYVVQVLGYTIKDGNYSAPFIVRTGEGGKYQY